MLECPCLSARLCYLRCFLLETDIQGRQVSGLTPHARRQRAGSCHVWWPDATAGRGSRPRACYELMRESAAMATARSGSKERRSWWLWSSLEKLKLK